ncbi:MAG: GvpL/GvpF family gas vesicle protein [Patescibacteria group bacterium]
MTTNEGKYIYSIIQENESRSFGSIGITNREVNLVVYRDIAAVVSNTPVIHFDRLDKAELTKYVAIHQKVNEVVMSAKGAAPAGWQGSASGGKEYDVVPMTFGIIAPSPDEVSRILEKAYLQFKMALRNVSGRAEFAVQVWWDPKRVLEELARTDPEIQKLKQELSSKGGIFGIPMKLKLGKLVHQKIEARKQEYIKDIHTVLNAIACDATFNKLIDEDMVVNFSFLMEKIKEPELDKKMQELGTKYEGKLRFKYIGPMPSYSFSNINLSLGNFEIIDEARKLLGLGEKVVFVEVKRAYYALSHHYHPDKHGGESETAEKMKEIIEAYRILENYCQSCDEFRGAGKIQKYSLKREDVENSLIIK